MLSKNTFGTSPLLTKEPNQQPRRERRGIKPSARIKTSLYSIYLYRMPSYLELQALFFPKQRDIFRWYRMYTVTVRHGHCAVAEASPLLNDKFFYRKTYFWLTPRPSMGGSDTPIHHKTTRDSSSFLNRDRRKDGPNAFENRRSRC